MTAMEDLNKNQIVLLTLLVSFVTSIATGIMTTSLLNQAPLEVTRNINSVVEKTIQQVVPANVLSAAPVQKEVTTVVVKEEDSIMAAIGKNIPSIVRINETDPVTLGTTFYGIGLVVTKDGIIAADRNTIVPEHTYAATMNDGTTLTVTPLGVDKKTNFILFKVVQDDKKPYAFVPATIGSVLPQLGQSVISIGGDSKNATAVGRVTSLTMKDATVGTTTTKYLGEIETDVSSKDLVDGSALLNLSGEIIGIELTSDNPKSFTPIALLQKELPILLEPVKAQ